ncbi:MAG TPA: methylated-DNA--[protein]-cysteine S-methyltransferase [Thermoanaerobaculia bacterium]|jgi:O-6-methylguanine DNA methyltransferase
MRCRSVLTRIDAMRTGELPAREAAHLHEHLATCSSCDESLADVTTIARGLKSLAAAPPRSCRDAFNDGYAALQTGDAIIHVAFSANGLRMIHRGGTFEEFRARYAQRYGRGVCDAELPERLRAQVAAAVAGEGAGKPQVDWDDDASPLEREVLATLARIPRGEVRTYEWVARQVGRPRAVRAVGTICAHNRVPLVVPCHRVVPSTGGVGQYAFGSAVKRELLRREGVDVDALETLARRGVRYIGSKTTKIVCYPTCKDARRIREENRVAFRGASDATRQGFRPCRRCQPFAA